MNMSTLATIANRAPNNYTLLIIDNQSSCKLRKQGNKHSIVENGLKITNKSVIYQKNYWSVRAAHDGYSKQYGIIHDRQIEFFPENNKFIGIDKLIKKKKK